METTWWIWQRPYAHQLSFRCARCAAQAGRCHPSKTWQTCRSAAAYSLRNDIITIQTFAHLGAFHDVAYLFHEKSVQGKRKHFVWPDKLDKNELGACSSLEGRLCLECGLGSLSEDGRYVCYIGSMYLVLLMMQHDGQMRAFLTWWEPMEISRIWLKSRHSSLIISLRRYLVHCLIVWAWVEFRAHPSTSSDILIVLEGTHCHLKLHLVRCFLQTDEKSCGVWRGKLPIFPGKEPVFLFVWSSSNLWYPAPIVQQIFSE